MYSYLSDPDIAPDDERYSDAWRRVLTRLGEYTALIVQGLNMRPTGVSLLERSARYVLVRISTPEQHVVLRIAPEGDLASEFYFSRTMHLHHLPAPRVIQHDLSAAALPFTYTIESYIGGTTLDRLAEPFLLRSAARQVGRVLRRMQRITMPGWGRPTVTGRWPQPDWLAVLNHLHATLAPPPFDALVFSASERAAVTAVLEDPLLQCAQPCLMHGAFGPYAVRGTTGANHVQLAALIDPGPYIGGDGMLDLAMGLDAAYPVAWRSGLLEGVAAAAPLSDDEVRRLRLLRILAGYWSAIGRYACAEPHEATRAAVIELLAETDERSSQ